MDPKPDIPNYDTNHVLTNEMAALALNYTFDFWGKQRNTIQAALGQKEAAQWQVAQARLVLAQAIVAQYTQWQLLDAQLAVVDKRIAVNEQLKALLAGRIRAGLLPGSAAYNQGQALLSLQSSQKQLQAERERTQHSLAALIGQPPTAVQGLNPQALGSVPVVAVNHLRADILGQRPDIAAQRALLQSRYFGVQAAKAEFYPNIEIKGLAGFSHIDAFDVLHSSSRLLGLMPAITLPIFTSGSLKANLAGKHAQYDEQVAMYDKTVVTALQQAADASSDYQHSQDALPLQQQAWQLAQKNADSSARRLRAGLDNGLNRLQLEDAALSAQGDYLKVASWQQQSWNNLQAALGGGFINPQATSAQTH
ncbi:TolC family protein [Snodgrassella sp. CFCC 13594]|uniref:TolC family protein n=1 Tax=Snodgrassella sp. CFCC 13594 TaxID=1775559 RepID=UPI0018D49A31|nr:TolC family protein [Snodgrassella sp. CFCC 13594]